MATDPQSLLNDAKCFLCLGMSEFQAMELVLLIQIQSAIAGGGGGSSSAVVPVGVVDPEGVVTAPLGGLYWNQNNQSLWIQNFAAGNIGWLQIV